MNYWNFIGSVGTGWLIAEWIIRLGSLFIVPRNRKPSSGTAWLLLIFLVPFFGIFLFLLLGSPKLPEARREAQKNLDNIIAKTLQKSLQAKANRGLLHAPPPDKYLPVARLSESLSHLPIFGGNKLEILPEYNTVIDKIVQDIDSAERFVYLEYFIIVHDEITDSIFAALARAVTRDVTVRVLYDSLSTKRFKGHRQMIKLLEDSGVVTQAMLPLRFPFPGKGYVRPDLRNHRKLVVVDGETAYTGSLNLVRRDYHRKDDIYYDELVVRAQGPVALQFAAVFLGDWYAETGALLESKGAPMLREHVQTYGDSSAQVLPSGPGYDDENNLKLFTGLIHAARQKIVITNPYFVPDDALTTAITSAAKRGVEVIMINSEAMDQWMVGHAQRSYYQTLLEAGVKIYLYKAPILLHSKFMTVDSELATIGSSNLDIRSFSLNLEVTLISYDARVVAELEKVETVYLSKSTQVDLADWQERSKKKQLLDNIARLTAALQ